MGKDNDGIYYYYYYLILLFVILLKLQISPSTVVDTLVAELTNLSLVAALMLTITLPLVCNPGNNIATKNYSWLYLTVGGGSVAG
jgi:branched-subunit amino acid permease